MKYFHQGGSSKAPLAPYPYPNPHSLPRHHRVVHHFTECRHPVEDLLVEKKPLVVVAEVEGEVKVQLQGVESQDRQIS